MATIANLAIRRTAASKARSPRPTSLRRSRFVLNGCKANDSETDYRVVSRKNGFELCAGSKRISQSNRAEYVSVTRSALEFGTIYGNIANAPGDDMSKKLTAELIGSVPHLRECPLLPMHEKSRRTEIGQFEPFRWLEGMTAFHDRSRPAKGRLVGDDRREVMTNDNGCDRSRYGLGCSSEKKRSAARSLGALSTLKQENWWTRRGPVYRICQYPTT